MRLITGIDPGLTGGIVTIADNGTLYSKDVMPLCKIKEKVQLDLDELGKILSAVQGLNRYFVLEKVASMPKQGVASSFKFGRIFGMIEGILSGISAAYILVPPQRWTREMTRKYTGKDPKIRAKQAVVDLFPEIDLLATSRSKVPHSGLVDALLLAEYGRRNITQLLK